MRALVTGANGLVGSNLVRELLRQGIAPIGLVRCTSDRAALNGLDLDTRIGDVMATDSIANAAGGCDIIFHVASVFAYWGYAPDELERIAVRGVCNVIDAAAQVDARRVVLTSSSVICGSSTDRTVRDERDTASEQELSPYVRSKAAQLRAGFEHARKRGVELVAVCPTITVGPHDTRLSPSNAMIVSYLADPFRSSFLGGCNIVSARDVAAGHLLAARSGVPGESYLLGSENAEWVAVHRTISELTGSFGPGITMNHTAAYLAATALELFARWSGKRPASTREQASMVGRYYWYSHDRAAALGYSPRPARQSLVEAIAWLVKSSHVSPLLRASLRCAPEVEAALQPEAENEH